MSAAHLRIQSYADGAPWCKGAELIESRQLADVEQSLSAMSILHFCFVHVVGGKEDARGRKPYGAGKVKLSRRNRIDSQLFVQHDAQNGGVAVRLHGVQKADGNALEMLPK